jgi:Tfp pilus assembly protein PilX
MTASLRSHSVLPRRRAQRGSLLTTALIFAAAIALTLGGYLQLCSSSSKLANRSFFSNAAMNLADAGVEKALWTLNQVTSKKLTVANAWSDTNGWTVAGSDARTILSDFPLPQNATAVVKVHVENYNGTGAVRPKIVAQAIISLKGAAPVMKYVEVDCRRRSPFSTGLVGINRVRFNGTKTTVDSWPGVGANGAPIRYTNAVRRNFGSVAALGVDVDSGSLSIGNADIYGTVATAGDVPLVGPNGTVSQQDPRVTGVVDPKLVTRDFAANFEDVALPERRLGDGYIAEITGNLTLGTTGAAARNVPEIDDTKVYRVYTVDEIKLTSSAKLSIAPNTHVVILLPAASGTTVQITGSASIEIPASSSLLIYTAGNVSIAGSGVANGTSSNPNPAVNFQLWGTRPTNDPLGRQNIAVAGNGTLSGIVYAPYADLDLRGHSSAGNAGNSSRYDVQGAMVAYNITMTGEESFHYDESLANWGGAAPFGITKWRELVTAADRALFADRLAF